MARAAKAGRTLLPAPAACQYGALLCERGPWFAATAQSLGHGEKVLGPVTKAAADVATVSALRGLDPEKVRRVIADVLERLRAQLHLLNRRRLPTVVPSRASRPTSEGVPEQIRKRLVGDAQLARATARELRAQSRALRSESKRLRHDVERREVRVSGTPIGVS